MKKNLKSLSIIMLTFSIMSCSGIVGQNENENNFHESKNEEIVLGAKRENPFSLKNSRSALENNNPNYIYFRIRTDKYENVEHLESILGDLNIVPIDYEIKEGGCFYNDNPGSEIYSPWFYHMVPVEIFEQAKSFGEVETLDEMYISDEALAKFTEESTEVANPSARFLWFNYKSVRPTGYVYFFDEVKKKNVPLQGVKVTVSQWCHVKSAYTDENGYYDIGENFTTCWQNTANVKIIFETNKDTIYDIGSIFKATNFRKDKNVSELSENNIYLEADTPQGNYGVLLNAATTYRKYARELNITEPKNLKFWGSTITNGGITLMQDVVIADFAAVTAAIGSAASLGVGTILGSITGAIAGTYLPDIIISLNTPEKINITKTESITETVFHEMAHASHFTGIGIGNITYWNEEYIKMLGGWAAVIWRGEDLSKNCYNNGTSKQVCLIESWGYFMGYYLMSKYYSNNSTVKNYKSRLLGNGKSYSYFYYDVYYELLKNYSVEQIFTPYNYFSVQSLTSWFEKFKSLNKEIDSEKLKDTITSRGYCL